MINHILIAPFDTIYYIGIIDDPLVDPIDDVPDLDEEQFPSSQ